MAANPITDQILAGFTDFGIHSCDDLACPVEVTAAEFAAKMLAALPGIDASVIGEVLLHAGALFRDFSAYRTPDNEPFESDMVAVNVFQLAGGALYGTPGAPA